MVNKAIGSVRRIAYMKIPKDKNYVGFPRASLSHYADEAREYIKVPVFEEPLDDILNSLGIDKIDLTKVNIEGYVTQALLGAIDSLSKTKYLIIEIFEEEFRYVHRKLRELGFRLVDARGLSYLYRNLKT